MQNPVGNKKLHLIHARKVINVIKDSLDYPGRDEEIQIARSDY